MSTEERERIERLLRRQELGRSTAQAQQRVVNAPRGSEDRATAAAVFQNLRQRQKLAEAGMTARQQLAAPEPPRDINASRAQLREQGAANLPTEVDLTNRPVGTDREIVDRQQLLQRREMDLVVDRPLNQPGPFISREDASGSIRSDLDAASQEAARNRMIRDRLDERFRPLEGRELVQAQSEEEMSRRRRSARAGAMVELGDEALAGPMPETERAEFENRRIAEGRRLEEARLSAETARAEQEQRIAEGSGTGATQEELEGQQRQLQSLQTRRTIEEMSAAPTVTDTVSRLQDASTGDADSVMRAIGSVHKALDGNTTESEIRAMESALLTAQRNIDEETLLGDVMSLNPGASSDRQELKNRIQAALDRIRALRSRT
jgi:hypothetical protein